MIRYRAILACAAATATVFCRSWAENVSVSAGVWQVEAGEAGVAAVYLAGQPLVRNGHYAGYLPGWQGTSFSLHGCERRIDDGRVVWTKRLDGVQDCTLTAAVADEGASLRLDTRLMAPGPSEFSVQIQPDMVRAAATHLVVKVDGEPRHIPLGDEPFERFSIKQSLVFETPDYTIRFDCPGMQLQDRRGRGHGLFLVRVLSRGSGDEREVLSEIRMTAEPVPPADREGRRMYLAQIPQTRREVPVRNPGMEDGLSHWSHSRLAAVDRDVRQEGDAAVRLHVPEAPAERNDVYITQSVPVTPGAIYELTAAVRTEDVVAATVGGMSSTGATVIVEFADPQGKWFAAGAYAKGLYGTSDWQQLSTKPVIAPEGAGFAIVYLAMRSLGTAWFDDVKLQEVTDHVVLISPLNGQSIDDNTPPFHWYSRLPAVAMLELATGADFADSVIRQTVPDPSPVSLDDVLQPGIWYWRVSYGPQRVSPVWSFTQTAAADRDCTPPVIEPAHGFLPTPRETVRIPVRDNIGVASCIATLNGRSVKVELRGDRAVYTPDVDWTEGLHRLNLNVSDAAGNTDRQTVFLTHLRDRPRRTWLLERGTMLGDAPDFPLGIYGIRIDDMAEVAAAGFTLVHSYAWDGAGDVESALEYLDAARSHGLNVFLGLYRRELMAGNDEFVAERVGTLMGHPALYAWYLYDEPDLSHQYVRPERLARFYSLIKQLDPFHPVILTCAANQAVPRFRESGDVYWTQVYGNTRFVASRIPTNRADLKPETAQAAILHCYDRTQSEAVKAGGAFDPAAFQPDIPTLRANAFMALTKRSSGLLWWWWGGGTQFKTVKDAPAAWAGLKAVVADIRALRPLLTAAGDVATQVVAPAEGVEVHVWEKRIGDRVLVIAVNRDEEACEAAIALELAASAADGRERFADRTIRVAGGVLRDAFPPLGVHVYELPAR